MSEERWKNWTHSSERKEWTDAFYSFTDDKEKERDVISEVDTSRSWKDLEWDKNREEAAKLVVEQEINKLSPEERDLYEEQSAKFWDEFYDKHNNKFFKQRNYLPNEFPELVYTNEQVSQDLDRKIVVELGCGNGSSFYPLIDLYKDLQPRPMVYGLDFSSTAIEHIKVYPYSFK